MMNFVRCGHVFSQGDLLYPARPDVPHLLVKKSIPIEGDTATTQPIFRPIPQNDRTTKDWTAIAWPTNIQSGTPDGKFGLAKIMDGWGDCWFLAPMAAVANDKNGHKILAESIKKIDGGYEVTFKGLPNNNLFISDSELDKCLDESGGDADTRLMELAAEKFLNERGNSKSLFIAAAIRGGLNQETAEQCFQNWCSRQGIQDPMTYNPMRSGFPAYTAFFMFTGMFPDCIFARSGTSIQISDVMRFLNQHITNDRAGALVAIIGLENPLGGTLDARRLVRRWDVIRTEITSNGTVDEQERAFLNTLTKWLETRDVNILEDLKSAAGNLKLQHTKPLNFTNLLDQNQLNMTQEHFSLLRSGVLKVLAGRPGFIGFTGAHVGTIEGINEATNRFTYFEPNCPTLVHTGELSDLIQAVRSRTVMLQAVDPTIGIDVGESSGYAETSKGRRLREIHHQVVRGGKIDPAESGPLADLVEMDDGTFRQVYDSDNNGVIEGAELKAVKLRVDRWVDHLELAPIW